MGNNLKIFGIPFCVKIALSAFMLFGIACSKLDSGDLPDDDRSGPTRIMKNAHVIFKDSGFIKIDLRSSLVNEYASADTPYTEFPKGLELNYFNKSIDSPGYLRADWAIMNEMKGKYEGKGNVVVISEEGDTLKTASLFWDRKNRLVYTYDTAYIITKAGDSLQANNGLEARDDLKEYTFYNNRGVKFIDKEAL